MKSFTINLKGNWETREVWLNGKQLDPAMSLLVSNHSPDGFNWGYGGSGPAQLALAICIELFGLRITSKFANYPFNYQKFKFDYIATLPQSDFEKTMDVEIESREE